MTLLKERLRARKQRPQKQSKHTVPKNRDWIEKEVRESRDLAYRLSSSSC